MASKSAIGGAVSIKAYRGDAKTLLAFDIRSEAARADLAGFTIQVTPPGVEPFYIQNNLRFEDPGAHAQDPKEPAFSSINAPIHKFRWVHVPGSVHQGLKPVMGGYRYTVTPRYFDAKASLKPLDPAMSVSVDIDVAPFASGKVAVGFTRGFTQSQAFVRHFGLHAPIKPKDAELLYDTSQESGVNATGEHFTFAQQYEWLGFTARERIFALLDEIVGDESLSLDLFAYDLNEPDFIKALLQLAEAKRIRIILDNAALHHASDGSKPEDEFEALFADKAGAEQIKRGKFSRYAHDKVLVVKKDGAPVKVLTGSTNFSVTGFYVNSNHVLVFDDVSVAEAYANAFQTAWDGDVHTAAFANSALATTPSAFDGDGLPEMSITFSPHTVGDATQILDDLVARVEAEGKVEGGKGSVLFAVMQLDGGAENPVYDALNALHENQSIFSYGISDTPNGIALYPVRAKTGVLVTGKPVNTQLPPPFNQVPGVGLGHQVHHKFVVCGFNGDDSVVYCGSSNLALKGEEVNGDNLLAIRNGDIATVFAIEALTLVDHFDFLDRTAKGPKAKGVKTPPALKQQASAAAGWFLGTTDTWSHKYFDGSDLHSVDRELFAG